MLLVLVKSRHCCSSLSPARIHQCVSVFILFRQNWLCHSLQQLHLTEFQFASNNNWSWQGQMFVIAVPLPNATDSFANCQGAPCPQPHNERVLCRYHPLSASSSLLNLAQPHQWVKCCTVPLNSPRLLFELKKKVKVPLSVTSQRMQHLSSAFDPPPRGSSRRESLRDLTCQVKPKYQEPRKETVLTVS